MRHPLITLALLAALALPFAAAAQEADEDEDPQTAALREMLMSEEGIPQADIGDEVNGWFFSREKGLCRMFSFNDPLVVQVDPNNPLNTGLRFQMIDGSIPEKDGTQLQMAVAVRGSTDVELRAFAATATVSQGMPATYVIPVPIKDLVGKFPNGFQMVLGDATGEKRIMQTDTLGTGKHLAALVKCAGG